MSLNERARITRSPSSVLAPGFIGISRSKSFSGPLCHKRHASSPSMGPGSEMSRSTWTMPVLGQSFRGNSLALRIYHQGTARLKLPKAPRPGRTAVMFEAVARGLRECIGVTEEDLNNLRSNIEEYSVTSEQQIKSAERYLKRLEYQLTKLDELQENYEIQQKLRDGVRSMAYAYVLSPGKEKEAALANVKSGYKECTETLCAIENQLQHTMGTLLFHMKGVQGFARICPGDVFEINLKYGQQKWRTKGRVLKNNQQAWDTPRVLFKALLGEVLHIKAVEVKGLGKTVVLGSKYCETKDLFSAHPQVMTLNLNPSGSLKLSVVITWNPLDGCVDEMTGLLPHGMSPASKKRSLPNYQHSFSTGSNGYHSAHSSTTGSSYSSDSLRSPNGDSGGSVGSTPDVEYQQHSFIERRRHNKPQPSTPQDNRHSWYGRLTNGYESQLTAGNNMQRSQTVDNGDFRHLRSFSTFKPPVINGSHNDSDRDLNFAVMRLNIGETLCNIREALQALVCGLEDIQGQYPELQKLERRVLELEKVLQKNSRVGSASSVHSDISISVESALECFDFLNTEADDELSHTDNRIREECKHMDPELTAKTTDSGISSIARQLSEDRGLNCSSPDSGDPSPVPLSTGHDQLDAVLAVHLSACKKLVDNLGSFGPLRCKEEQSLEKLRRQAYVLQRVLKISCMTKESKKILSGADELRDNQLQTLWQHCALHEDNLYVGVGNAVDRLIGVYRGRWERQYPGLTLKVMKLLMCRLLDVPRADPASLLTVYHVLNYFYFVEQGNVDRHLDDLAREVSLVETLQSGDVAAITQTLDQMSVSLPPPDCFKAVGELLMCGSGEVRRRAVACLRNINDVASLRKQVIMVFVELLEEDSQRTREGASLALSYLEAVECIDQLAYISQTDGSHVVRQAAKEALLSLGDEGRRAFDQCQLASHGFHGLGIN